MERRCLTVCLYLTHPDVLNVPLTQLAAGHVFGPCQSLKIVLQGIDNDAMTDIATDVQDCCFPLVKEVSTVAASCYDFILVFLCNGQQLAHGYNHGCKSEETEVNPDTRLVHSAVRLGNTIGNSVEDHTRILILGEDSNLVASLLSHHLGGLSANRLLAFQPELPQRQRINSQYQMADILCQTVSDWWAGIKRHSADTKAGMQFFGKANKQTDFQKGLFFSVPVEVAGVATYKVSPGVNFDSLLMSTTLDRTSKAIQEMKLLSNGGHETSTKPLTFMSCL